MRFLLLVFSFFVIPAWAWVASPIHQHSSRWEGVLPCPYDSIEFEMRLNPENDDVLFFQLLIAGSPVQFFDEDLQKLKDLELGTMRVREEIYRLNEAECQPEQGFLDWVYISMEMGPRYRISWEDDDGKVRYQWGRDVLTIMVTMGTEGSIRVTKQSPPGNVSIP